MGSLVNPTVSVSPQGAGTCTFAQIAQGDINTIDPTWAAGHGEYRNFRYTATPAAGYRFKQFEVTVSSVTVDFPHTETTIFQGTQSGANWIYEPDLTYWSNYWYLWGYSLWWTDPDFPSVTGEVTAISVVAVFERSYTPTHLLVNSYSKSFPVQLLYDPTTNLLVADY